MGQQPCYYIIKSNVAGCMIAMMMCIAPIEIAGRKFDEICFASLLIQKG